MNGSRRDEACTIEARAGIKIGLPANTTVALLLARAPNDVLLTFGYIKEKQFFRVQQTGDKCRTAAAAKRVPGTHSVPNILGVFSLSTAVSGRQKGPKRSSSWGLCALYLPKQSTRSVGRRHQLCDRGPLELCLIKGEGPLLCKISNLDFTSLRRSLLRFASSRISFKLEEDRECNEARNVMALRRGPYGAYIR